MAQSRDTQAPAVEVVDELTRLRAENARLKAELENARTGKPAGRQEFVPDWIPEGTRQELEMTGRAINPFTGARLGDWPADEPAVTAARPAVGDNPPV